MATMSPPENVIVTRNIQTDTLVVGLPIYQAGIEYIVLKFMPNPFGPDANNDAGKVANRRAMLQHLHQQIVEQLAVIALDDSI